jgi:hypothetical protein
MHITLGTLVPLSKNEYITSQVGRLSKLEVSTIDVE